MLIPVFRNLALWFALSLSALLLTGCGGTGEPAAAPTNVTARAGDGRVTLTWTVEPGVEVWLFYAEGEGVTPQNWNAPGRNGRAVVNVTSPYVVTGLTNGTLYSFTLNGRRDGGPGGPGSPAVTATPRLAGASWTLGTPVANAEFRAASAAASGTFAIVAVGTHGGIYTSEDGIAWTSRGSATVTSKNLNGVATNGFTTIAVGDEGTIVRSEDPATWTVVNSGTTAKLNGAAWGGNGIAVVVGDGGTILSSANSTEWSARSSGTTANLYKVAWLNSRFVAVGDNGTVLESTDAVTWTVRSLASLATALTGVAYGTGQYVVIGQGGTIYTSPDLSTWTPQTAGTSIDLHAIAAGSQLVAAGDAGTVLISADGKTWNPVTSGTTANLRAATARAGGYILLGAGGVNLTSY